MGALILALVTDVAGVALLSFLVYLAERVEKWFRKAI
jgi:hypothetical protein